MKSTFFAFLLVIQFTGFAQRLLNEVCIGNEQDEQHIYTHRNNDSSISYLIKKVDLNANYSNLYSLRLIKLNGQKEVIVNRLVDSVFGFFSEKSIYFEEDGSFIIQFSQQDTINYNEQIKICKLDKSGHFIWMYDSLILNSLDFVDANLVINKANNGDYLINNKYSYANINQVLCIENNGNHKWLKDIDLTYFDGSFNTNNSATIIPMANNNFIIYYNIMHLNWSGIDGLSRVIFLVDGTGNTIKSDTIYKNTNYLNAPFYALSDYSHVNYFFDINHTIDSTNDIVRVKYSGIDLSILQADTLKNNIEKDGFFNYYDPSYGYANYDLIDKLPITDTTNFFIFPDQSVNNDSLVYCKTSNNQIIWSCPYNDTIKLDGTIKRINNHSILINKTLLRNGGIVWRSNVDLSDTIYYKGNTCSLASKRIQKFGNDYYYTSLYTYNIFNGIYKIQLIDMNTGLVKESSVIEIKSNAFNSEYFGNRKSYVIGNSNSICHFGNNDTHIAYYENNANTITGIAYIDYNNNNAKENNEPLYPYGYVTTESNSDTQTQHLSGTLPFLFNTDTGKYTTRLALYNNYYSSTPANFISNHSTYQNADTILFALHPIGNKNDVSVQLINNWMTRLGQNNAYTISIENKGTTTANGKLKLRMDSRLKNVTTSPNYAYQNGDTLVWNIGNLLPIQKGESVISFTAETPTTLNANDTLNSIAWYESDSIDITPINNFTELKEVVRTSYDPNEKAISYGETLSTQQINNGTYISYIIHFQNKGNDTAFKVIVLDTLSENVDIHSLEIVHASHSYTLEIIGRKILKFTFENIKLSSDTLNISSTGYIAYKIKPISTLGAGSSIYNSAHIYFDYNAPIKTNTVQTKILLVSNVYHSKNANGKMNIFPNPNNGNFTIKFESKGLADVQLQLFDVSGKIILSKNIVHQQETILELNETDLAKGIYWIKLSDGSAEYTSSIIVQ